jgi:glycosyltransferase involved in cell wall biosynthesis
MAAKKNVLLSAYQCGPGLGSVSQIGWEWYRRLAQHEVVTLITHIRNRQALETAGAPFAGSQIHYIDTEWFAGPLYRMACRLFPKSQHAAFMTASLDYYVFDRAAYIYLAKQPCTWDVAHIATPVSPQAHSVLHRLGLPIIRGPLNGGLGVPKQFHDLLRQDQTWLYPLRDLGRCVDALQGSSTGTSVLLTANSQTRAAVSKSARDRCRTMLENAVDLNVFFPGQPLAPPSASEPLRILTVGRLVPFKALPLLFRAVAQLGPESPVIVDVVGDGPMRVAWESCARDLRIESKIVFHGEQNAIQVAAHMRQCHVFCLPSIRESGGAVLLEAMSSARPVVAVDYGGPAEIVHSGVGRLLSAESADAVVRDLVTVLNDIRSRPEVWIEKGLAARREAEQLYSWEAKVEQACRLYRELTPDAPPHSGVALQLSTSRS